MLDEVLDKVSDAQKDVAKARSTTAAAAAEVVDLTIRDDDDDDDTAAAKVVDLTIGDDDDDDDTEDQARLLKVVVPPGSVGIQLLRQENGLGNYVSEVRSDSIVKDKVSVGDHLVAINDTDVRKMDCLEIKDLFRQNSKTLYFLRDSSNS